MALESHAKPISNIMHGYYSFWQSSVAEAADMPGESGYATRFWNILIQKDFNKWEKMLHYEDAYVLYCFLQEYKKGSGQNLRRERGKRRHLSQGSGPVMLISF